MNTIHQNFKLQSGWEVETCINIPTDEIGDIDLDNATYHIYEFKTKEKAIEKAKELLKNDKMGSVVVTEFEYQKYEEGFAGSYKKYISEPIYIEND